MQRSLILAVAMLATALVGARYAVAGQAPAAADRRPRRGRLVERCKLSRMPERKRPTPVFSSVMDAIHSMSSNVVASV